LPAGGFAARGRENHAVPFPGKGRGAVGRSTSLAGITLGRFPSPPQDSFGPRCD